MIFDKSVTGGRDRTSSDRNEQETRPPHASSQLTPLHSTPFKKKGRKARTAYWSRSQQTNQHYDNRFRLCKTRHCSGKNTHFGGKTTTANNFFLPPKVKNQKKGSWV